MLFGRNKRQKFCNVITHNVIGANQKTESAMYHAFPHLPEHLISFQVFCQCVTIIEKLAVPEGDSNPRLADADSDALHTQLDTMLDL